MAGSLTFEELGVAVATLRTLNVQWNSYVELAEALKKQFGVNICEHALFLYFEPTIEEEERDLRIHLNLINNV